MAVPAGPSDLARDVRRELMRTIPALRDLTGVERDRAISLIEYQVEEALVDYGELLLPAHAWGENEDG